MEAVTLAVTTNSGGNGSVVSARGTGSGFVKFLVAVDWRVGDFASGVDAVLSCVGRDGVETALLTLTDANADARYNPRVPTHDNAGAAESDSTLMIVDGDLKLTVTSGGNVKSGSAVVYLLDA